MLCVLTLHTVRHYTHVFSICACALWAPLCVRVCSGTVRMCSVHERVLYGRVCVCAYGQAPYARSLYMCVRSIGAYVCTCMVRRRTHVLRTCVCALWTRTCVRIWSGTVRACSVHVRALYGRICVYAYGQVLYTCSTCACAIWTCMCAHHALAGTWLQ